MSKKLLFLPLALLILAVGGFIVLSAQRQESLLPAAAPSDVVILSDGDTYELISSEVQKDVAGKAVRMLAYNGSIPGPLIKISQGAEITLKFTNNTDRPA